MRHDMALSRTLFLVPLLTACGGAALEAPANNPQAAQVAAVVAEPVVDQRSVGQMIVDAITPLGYACAQQNDVLWFCNPPPSNVSTNNWTFGLTFSSDGTNWNVELYTSEIRAFGHRCAQYINHMRDLANPSTGFSVECNDDGQEFRMRTVAVYVGGDMGAWVQWHLNDRAQSKILLKKAHALR
jgi:hypothetical protein